MKITAVCITYLRPALLAEMIGMFELQTHEDRELVILDDAGQYHEKEGDRWRIVSKDRRYKSLGKKRNDSFALASDDSEAYAIWDDDDVYLPWALESVANALEKGPWARASVVFDEVSPGVAVPFRTYGEDPDFLAYHGAYGFRREAFEKGGGYRTDFPHDEDIKFIKAMRGSAGPSVDPICPEYPDPYYVYRRHSSGSYHMGCMPAPELVALSPDYEVERIDIEPTWPTSYQLIWGSAPVSRRCWQ